MTLAATVAEPRAQGNHAHDISRLLDLQRTAYRNDPLPSAMVRRQRLNTLMALVVQNEGRLVAAIERDFGVRARIETLFAEIVASLSSLRLAERKVEKWMRPKRVSTPMHMQPGKSMIRAQPLGVVGVISPWNYPVYLALSPIASALAAGNRVLLKPSELTPHTSATLQELIGSAFDEDVLAVVCGGAECGAAFASAPFDHLLFTGSSAIGRKVALAAAANLTPVTLELGGKSPAIIDDSANLDRTARAIVFGKAFNAGQTCVAPDYVITSSARLDHVVDALAKAARSFYPEIDDTGDYSAIITDHHFARLQAMVQQARAAGATIVEIGSPDKLAGKRKLPFTIVVDPPRDSAVMREEIFGPILPVVSVGSAKAAVDLVNDGERPLALYWFGTDAGTRDMVLDRTVSGGVTINDTNWHVVQENLPFGGVGNSGCGVYHGQAGFETFSNMKPIFFQSRLSTAGFLYPPYTAVTERMLALARKLI